MPDIAPDVPRSLKAICASDRGGAARRQQPASPWVRWIFLVSVLCLSACASLPDHVDRPVSTALANPAQTRLGSVIADRAKRTGTQNDSGFALVGSAELAFTSRMTLIKAAEKTLDLQYYAIFSDKTTERLFDALRKAAARGVRVRILLDDFNTSGKNAQVLKLAFEKNMELRLFNPLPGGRSSLALRIITNLNEVDQIQRRMHNKMLVADNALAIAGGRNLGETYFGQSPGTNFVDVDVLAAGRIARDLSRSFDWYWNNALSYPVQSLMTAEEIDALKPEPVNGETGDPADPADAEAARTAAAESMLPMPLETVPTSPDTTAETAATPIAPLPDSTNLRLLKWTWAPSTLLVDKPGKIAADADSTEAAEDTTVDGLLQLMSQAKTDLLIVSPYFVPGERTMRQFADVRKRGVRVRVLTNSLASNDAIAAHVGYARYRKALLEMGVEIFEMRAEQEGSFRSFGSAALSTGSIGGSTGNSGGGSSRASLHSKVVVIDDRLLVVGSMNLDLRSQLQNSEVAIAIRSGALSNEAVQLIEPTMATGAYHVELDGGHLVWRAPQGSNLKDSTTEPDSSALIRFAITLLGPFAPEEML